MKNNKYDYVLFTFIISLVLITAFLGRGLLMMYRSKLIYVNMNLTLNSPTVIIDAGHGGEDCGAIGIDGILEKDLNLLLSEEIREILSSQNINVVMTRTEDKLLYKEEQNIKGQRKLYDLKNRYLIASEYENSIFVSIHMNKYPEEIYKGLVVYYSQNNERSKSLALSVQNNIKEHLQSTNNRQIKNAKNDIYLLDRITSPAILIECGFLSNEDDCKNLQNDEYRKKMALIISNSIIENIY
ncbi:MAG: N-acetylmuramoyl-L-alanine amidase [Clostridia bacterium]|nr:N-acetylmuramoyl-L-alanine amidase [Clostridia bacterium]